MDMNGNLSRLIDEVAKELGMPINYIGKKQNPPKSLSDKEVSMQENTPSFDGESDNEQIESDNEPKTRKR